MSVSQADPWQVKNNIIEQQKNENNAVIKKFEDNFTPKKLERRIPKISDSQVESNVTGSQQLEPLPDSANYLQLLERKLQKAQKGTNLLNSLQEKKQDCMRSLLASNEVPATTLEQLLDFNTPIESGRLHRHLLPVQAVTLGETLQIIKYDALEDQTLEDCGKSAERAEEKSSN